MTDKPTLRAELLERIVKEAKNAEKSGKKDRWQYFEYRVNDIFNQAIQDIIKLLQEEG
jgi:hypothetical protein